MNSVVSTSNVSYAINKIVGENKSQIFRIDTNTGNLFINYDELLSKKVLNEVKNIEFELLIEAKDSLSSNQVLKSYTVKLLNEITQFTQSTKSIQLEQTTNLEEIDTLEKIKSTTVQFQLPMNTASKIESNNQRLIAPEFEFEKFKFIVKNPKKDHLIGKISLKNQKSNGRLVQMSIEPLQFRNWFIIDPRVCYFCLYRYHKLKNLIFYSFISNFL